MAEVIRSAQLTRFELKQSREISSSQRRWDTHHLGTLELTSSEGLTGLGFFWSTPHPLPPVAQLEVMFAREAAPDVIGQSAAALLNRVTRPRGWEGLPMLAAAVDQALWDIHAKELGLPLYRLLGGTRDRVGVYASGLDFTLSTEAMQAFHSRAKARGFTAFKLKVGHPDLKWDLERLRSLVEVVGRDALIMVDANEAWSPKEAIRRAHAYRDAGFDIYWIEDPCLRDDYEGLASVCEAVPFSHITSGEYLDLRGKAQLMAARAVDVLNIHGYVSEAIEAARLAASYGIPVHLGNSPMEMGVHLGAALPEVDWLEYSKFDYDFLLEEPVLIKDGFAYTPERPGHGLVLSEAARKEFARPDGA